MIRIFDPVLPNKELVKQSIDEIFETGLLTNFGKYCGLFEDKIKELVGCKYAVAVTNCDTALKLCISALEMSRVVLPTFTFNSTWMGVAWNGIKDIIVDVDPQTLLVDLNTIEEYAKTGVKDFLLVNVFGNLYDIDELNTLKNKYNLNILFDSAHSFGSTYKGKKSGNFGYTECFSFSATKVITSGEGGVICTDDPKLYNKLKYMRNYGFQLYYNSIYQGCNGKLTEMNSIVGYHSMNIFSDVLQNKKNNVNHMKERLKNKYSFQKLNPSVDSCYKDFILLDIDYEKVSKALKDADIQHKKYFLPLHMQNIVKSARFWYKYKFPNAEIVYKNSVCIPAHAKLTSQEIDTICEVLNAV